MAMSVVRCIIEVGGGESPTHLSSKEQCKVKEVGFSFMHRFQVNMAVWRYTLNISWRGTIND